MVSQEIRFSVGGLLILSALMLIGIAILANVLVLNPGVLLNIGGIGLLIGFLGFYLIANAMFKST